MGIVQEDFMSVWPKIIFFWETFLRYSQLSVLLTDMWQLIVMTFVININSLKSCSEKTLLLLSLQEDPEPEELTSEDATNAQQK